jgi:hypothetical protein
MKVKCNRVGDSLYCSECLHSKLHSPFVWPSLGTCKDLSPCDIICEDCRCVEIEMEIIDAE